VSVRRDEPDIPWNDSPIQRGSTKTADFPEHWKFVRRERGERRDDERDQRENEQNFMV
jgi:hypothetical protein